MSKVQRITDNKDTICLESQMVQKENQQTLLKTELPENGKTNVDCSIIDEDGFYVPKNRQTADDDSGFYIVEESEIENEQDLAKKDDENIQETTEKKSAELIEHSFLNITSEINYKPELLKDIKKEVANEHSFLNIASEINYKPVLKKDIKKEVANEEIEEKRATELAKFWELKFLEEQEKNKQLPA